MTTTKTIIGLTGNIATGKSVVRRMLTNAGALGLDADVIAHRLYYQNGPAYQKVIDTFGPDILSEDGQISRQKLGKTVFSDAKKLRTLEAILHPLVTESILRHINQSQTPIIVIEAIKLFEAGVDQICDKVWVSQASNDVQLARLMQNRKLTKQAAMLRLESQTSQIEKRKQADVVINTESSFFDTWQEVIQVLNDTIQTQDEQFFLNLNTSQGLIGQPAGRVPGQRLANFWVQHTRRDLDELYELLGSRLIITLQQDQAIKGMAIWQEWNFTANLKQMIIAESAHEFADKLLKAFEEQSGIQQCEILLIPPARLQAYDLNLSDLGYDNLPTDELYFLPWRTIGRTITQDKSGRVWVKILNNPLEDLAQKNNMIL